MENKCYVCGSPVNWVSDKDAVSEYGLSEKGIVHEYECPNCGAIINVFELEMLKKSTGTDE